MIKFKPKYKKHIKLVIALIIIVLGSVFMIIPFIPLGFILLFAGLVLLVPYVPFLNRLINQHKKRNKNKIVKKIEEKIQQMEGKIVTLLVKESL